MTQTQQDNAGEGQKLYVAPQIRPEQLPELKAEGIRAIICNRPDGEEAGQPTFAEIEQAAREQG
ncbi:beta-lactamase hydrolase domain-containing protein, partial [Brevirhabdus pacifica]